MKIDSKTHRKPRIEMLPLIDIVFLLLVFFIYAMLSMAVHRGLPVVLPKSETAKIDKQLSLAITIDADGNVFVDDTPILLKDLKDFLEKKAQSGNKPGVLLFADENLPYQQLFYVLDQIRKAGLERISLQAEADQIQ